MLAIQRSCNNQFLHWLHVFPLVTRSLSYLDDWELLHQDNSQSLEIQSYHEDGFTINHIRYRSSIILLPKMTLLWNAPSSIQEITRKDVGIFGICFPSPQMVVIGTGSHLVPIPSDLRHYFKELGIMMEVADTKSACSIFNLLSREGRLMGACLLPLERKK
jgi:uncharacterized protein